MFTLRIILLQVSLLSVVIGGTCSLPAQNCNLPKYRQAMATADSLIAAGKYVAANDQYNAAKLYCRDSTNKVQGKQDELLRSMVALRAASERKTREVLATDLINKSKQEQNRTIAFRLAEHAFKVNPESPKTLQRLHEVSSPNYLWPFSYPMIEHERIEEVVFSADSTMLATYSTMTYLDQRDKSALRIWDAQNGTLRHTLILPPRWDEDEGRNLLPPYEKRNYDRSEEVIQELAYLEEMPSLFWKDRTYILFTPDNKTCIAYDKKLTRDSVKIFDLTTGRKLHAIKAHQEPLAEMAISPNGKYVGTTGRDQMLTIWEIPSGKQISHLEGIDYHFRFFPDNRHILSILSKRKKPKEDAWGLGLFSSDEKTEIHPDTMMIWDFHTGKELISFVIPDAKVRTTCISLDGEKMATILGDSTIKIWGSQNGQELYSIKDLPQIPAHTFFHPSGKQLHMVFDDGELIWDMETQTTQSKKLSPNEAYAFSFPASHDKKIVLKDPFGKIQVKDSMNDQSALSFQGVNQASLFLSPIKETIFWKRNHYVDTLFRWDMKANQEGVELVESDRNIRSLSISQQGDAILCLDYQGVVSLWRAQKEAGMSFHRDVYMGGKNFRSVHFSSDGQWFITASKSGYTGLWDAQTGELMKSFFHSEYLRDARISPDNQYIISFSRQFANAWEVSTGNLLYSLDHEDAWIDDVVF